MAPGPLVRNLTAVTSIIDTLLVAVFLLATGVLAVYGMDLYLLVLRFRRRYARVRENRRSFVGDYRAHTPDAQWLGVTTQIPIYNEADVATRIINAAAAMDYPRGLHSIQVLDDSSD